MENKLFRDAKCAEKETWKLFEETKEVNEGIVDASNYSAWSQFLNLKNVMKQLFMFNMLCHTKQHFMNS